MCGTHRRCLSQAFHFLVRFHRHLACVLSPTDPTYSLKWHRNRAAQVDRTKETAKVKRMARVLRRGDTVHTVFPIDCLPGCSEATTRLCNRLLWKPNEIQRVRALALALLRR